MTLVFVSFCTRAEEDHAIAGTENTSRVPPISILPQSLYPRNTKREGHIWCARGVAVAQIEGEGRAAVDADRVVSIPIAGRVGGKIDICNPNCVGISQVENAIAIDPDGIIDIGLPPPLKSPMIAFIQ